MSSDESKIKGTVEQYKKEDSTGFFDYVNKKDIALFVGLILLLNFLGLINIPYVNQLNAIPYSDIINIVIISFLITFGTVWQRFKKLVEEIHNKNWVRIIALDSSGNVIGAFKTDPETLSNPDLREFKDGADRIKHYRDGIDVPTRRYALVKDIEQKDDYVELENIQGWDEVPADDQIISDKTSLRSWVDNVLPEAQKGRQKRLAENSIREKIISKVVEELAVKFEHSTSKDVINLDELYDEVIEGYESVNPDVNDYIEETEIVKKEDIVEENKQESNNNIGNEQ